jgi:hypothetical protein
MGFMDNKWKGCDQLSMSDSGNSQNFTPYQYRKTSVMRIFKLDLIQTRDYCKAIDI